MWNHVWIRPIHNWRTCQLQNDTEVAQLEGKVVVVCFAEGQSFRRDQEEEEEAPAAAPNE